MNCWSCITEVGQYHIKAWWCYQHSARVIMQ